MLVRRWYVCPGQLVIKFCDANPMCMFVSVRVLVTDQPHSQTVMPQHCMVLINVLQIPSLFKILRVPWYQTNVWCRPLLLSKLCLTRRLNTSKFVVLINIIIVVRSVISEGSHEIQCIVKTPKLYHKQTCMPTGKLIHDIWGEWVK